MKIKKLWIPALILGIIGCGAKLGDTVLNREGSKFIMSSAVSSAIFLCSLILILLIGVIMLISDKGITAKGSPSKNIPAGLFGFIASVAITGCGVITLLSIGSTPSMTASLINGLASVTAGMVLLYESCISFTGHNGIRKTPLLALIPCIWSCIRLIFIFLEYNRVSIHATEMYDVIAVALLSLFLYYHGLYYSELNQNTAIRRTALYGILFAVCSLIVTADLLVKMFYPPTVTGNVDTLIVEPTVARLLTCSADIALSIYSLFFVGGMLKKASFTEIEDDDYEYDDDSSDEAPEKEEEDTEAAVEPAQEKIIKFDIPKTEPEPEPKAETKPETKSDFIPSPKIEPIKPLSEDQSAEKDKVEPKPKQEPKPESDFKPAPKIEPIKPLSADQSAVDDKDDDDYISMDDINELLDSFNIDDDE